MIKKNDKHWARYICITIAKTVLTQYLKVIANISTGSFRNIQVGFFTARWFSLAPLLVIVCCYVRGSPPQGALEWRVSFLGCHETAAQVRFINEGYPAAHAAISLFGAPQTNSPSSTMWFLHINKAGSPFSLFFFLISGWRCWRSNWKQLGRFLPPQNKNLLESRKKKERGMLTVARLFIDQIDSQSSLTPRLFKVHVWLGFGCS